MKHEKKTIRYDKCFFFVEVVFYYVKSFSNIYFIEAERKTDDLNIKL